MIRLDTHVVVWLYTGKVERLGADASRLIDEHVPTISPMVQLELAYLHEIGRLTIGGADVVADLGRRIGMARSDVPLEALVDTAAALTWTRDPFDRLIVADALVAGAALITEDWALHDRTDLAVW